MLMIALISLTTLAHAASTVTITGSELYSHMNSEEKVALSNSLEEHGLTVQNYSDLKLEIDFDQANIAIIADDPTAPQVRKWFIQGGINYFFPVGPGISAEGGILTLSEYRLVGLELSAHTTGHFRYGSGQTYDMSPRFHFWRGQINVGPIFQVVHIRNPNFDGKQNYFYKALGLSAGYEFTRVFNRTGFNIGIFIQVTTDQYFKKNMPFILIGGGIKIGIFHKSR